MTFSTLVRFVGTISAAAMAGGCAPRPGNEDHPAADPAPHLDWTHFPEAASLLIAQLPGVITAPRSENLRAPAAGRLRVLPAATAGELLPAGTQWARFEPDDAKAEAASLARAEHELADRREAYRRDELPAALARLDGEIAAAKEEAALAQFAEQSPQLFQGDAAALDPRLRPRKTGEQARAQVQLLERRRAGLNRNDPAVEPVDLQAGAAALTRARQAHQDRMDRMNLTVPFSGRLRLARSDQAAEVHVEAGEVIAEIADPHFWEIQIRASLPLLHSVDAATLFCTVAIPGGGEATGDFRSSGFEAGGTSQEPVMRFRIRSSGPERLNERLFGVALPALVFTRLGGPARIVPKLTLAEADPDGKLQSGWRDGLARLYPGARFVAEGRAAVAVLPP
jgi:hypothetical protein